MSKLILCRCSYGHLTIVLSFKGTRGRFCVGFVEKMNLHLTYFIANERMKRPKMKTKRLHTNVCVMTTRLWVAKTVAVRVPSFAEFQRI